MSTPNELLSRAQKALEASDDHYELQDSIEEFLAAEPEAEPVTDEPVAFCDLTLNGKSIAYFEGKPIIMVGNVGNACHPYALYLHPPKPEPARKPMTEEEINRELPFECSGIYFDGFRDGIAVAEKHYGIGGSDE